MKSVITASTIFILIIVLVSASLWYVDDFTDEMLSYNNENEKFIAKNDWESAKKEIKKIEKVWKKKRQIMEVLVNHSYTDKLGLSIVQLKNSIENKEKEEFLKEKINFQLLLTNLEEQQQITIGNIF